MDTELLTVLALIAIGLAVVVGGAYLYPVLKRKEQGYPLERQIEDAMLPVVYKAILAAYQLSEDGMDDLQTRMTGLDKKQIADYIYSMLPDKIGEWDLRFVKGIISRERFEDLVQEVFDDAQLFISKRRALLDSAFDKWQAEQEEVV